MTVDTFYAVWIRTRDGRALWHSLATHPVETDGAPFLYSTAEEAAENARGSRDIVSWHVVSVQVRRPGGRGHRAGARWWRCSACTHERLALTGFVAGKCGTCGAPLELGRAKGIGAKIRNGLLMHGATKP